VLELLLQGGAGALVQGNGDGHDVLRKSLIVTEVANHLCCVETLLPVGASLPVAANLCGEGIYPRSAAQQS